ncbi:MAG: D-aminoacylase [Parvularculaceae bacterium]
MRDFTLTQFIGPAAAGVAAAALAACGSPEPQSQEPEEGGGALFDVVILDGLIYDGSGQAPYAADLAIRGDRIAAIGEFDADDAAAAIDASGQAVAPGFINMLSWATRSLIHDPRALSDVRQGVTLEVFGEGWSEGPYTPEMIAEQEARQGDIKFDIEWTTLGEYLEFLEAKGVTPNVASFVGATTLRIHEIGYEDRAASAEELARMQELVRDAMREGAMGVGSSLIYAPANFASTEELTALVGAAAEYGGMYISHMRSEAGALLEAVDELIGIARATEAPAEIYHLKAAGRANWGKLDSVIEKVEAARAEGLAITADMYTYHASSTGLNAAMPLWVQEGGHDAWVARLRDPEIRARVADEMRNPPPGFENRLEHAGGADGVLLLGFRNPELKPLAGMTLAQVAEMRGTPPEETAIDLVIEDDSRVTVAYFIMSEDNVKKKLALPWVAFDSDAAAPAPEGVFLQSSTHPRAYGSFARVIGKYVRDESVIPLEEAIRKLTSFPAQNLKIRDRGRLEEGYYADIVIFDPETVTDHATFEEPHQLATGVNHVFVNGVAVLRDMEHTGATPGRVVRGPGWTGWDQE